MGACGEVGTSLARKHKDPGRAFDDGDGLSSSEVAVDENDGGKASSVARRADNNEGEHAEEEMSGHDRLL